MAKYFWKKTVGWKENIKIGLDGEELKVSATCDTGNGGIAPTLSVDSCEFDETSHKVSFDFDGHHFHLRVVGITTPQVGTEHATRYAVDCDYIEVGGRRIKNVQIAISDKRKKSTQALINRKTLRDLMLVVDPDLEFTH